MSDTVPKSLPIKAAFRSLPEWHRSLLWPGFPRQTSKAWCTQAPMPAEGTFSGCQFSWEQGLGCLLWLLLFSFLWALGASLQPIINRPSRERKGQARPGGAQLWVGGDVYLQTLKWGVIRQLWKAFASSSVNYDFKKCSWHATSRSQVSQDT